MSEILKPCPFCGESSRVEINTYTEQIVCGQCGAVVYYKYWDTRPIEDDLRKRIAELEGAYIKAEDMLDDVILERAIEIGGLKKRIAELEEQVWNLNLENERLEEAYWIDESIAPDGTLKPCVRKLLERLEKAETDLRLSDDLVKALDNRIAELTECIGSQMADVYTLKARIAELTECIGSQMADVYTLKARIAELSQAVGLITTLKPTMVMDVDHPLEMAKEVAEYVTARIAELEGLAQQLVWVGNDLLTDNNNPVTITLFSGLAFRSKGLLP